MPATIGAKWDSSSCRPAKYHGAFATSGVAFGFAISFNGASNRMASRKTTAIVPAATTTWRTSRCGHVKTSSCGSSRSFCSTSFSTTPRSR